MKDCHRIFRFFVVTLTIGHRGPAEHVRFHVYHTAAGYRGRRGNFQIFRFENQVGRVGELDNFSRHKTQLFVVVKHSVHVFDPNGVDGPVEH